MANSFEEYPYTSVYEEYPFLVDHTPFQGANLESLLAVDWYNKGVEAAFVSERSKIDEEARRVRLQEVFSYPPSLEKKIQAVDQRSIRVEAGLQKTQSELERIREEFREEERQPGARQRCFHKLAIVRSANVVRKLAFIQVVRQIQRLNEQGYNVPIQKSAEIDTYSLAESVITKIGGKSLQDIASGKNISPSEFLQMLVEAGMIGKGKPADAYLEENEGRLTRLFPATTRDHILLASSEIVALCLYGDDPSVKFYLQRSGDDDLVIKCWDSMIMKISKLREDLRRTLANSLSSEFEPLMARIGEYVHQNALAHDLCIYYTIRMQDDYALINSFRHFSYLTDQDPQNELYAIIKKYIRETVKRFPSSRCMLTDEDTSLFLVNEDESVEAVPWVALKDGLHKVQGVTKEKKISVDVTRIDWGNLTPPQAAILLLDNVNPRYGTLIVHYENEPGDTEDITVTINIKKEEMRWNFINAPSTLPLMRDTLLAAMQQVMCYVYEHEIREKERRIMERRVQAAHSCKASTVVRTLSFAEERAGREKMKTRPSPQPVKEESTSRFDSESREAARKACVTYDKERLEKLLRRFSPEDVLRVREALDQFDPSVPGAVKQLTKTWRGKGRRFSIRVPSQNEKSGIRILLDDVEHIDGVQIFPLLDVVYRRDLFRTVHAS